MSMLQAEAADALAKEARAEAATATAAVAEANAQAADALRRGTPPGPELVALQVCVRGEWGAVRVGVCFSWSVMCL